MALLFCDSFDHYATAERAAKYPAYVGSGTVGSSQGRNGNGYRMTNNSHGLRRNIGKNEDTYIMGAAVRISTAPSAATVGIYGLMDSSTIHFDVRIPQNTRNLIVTRNGTTLQTSSFTLSDNVWHYIECKVTIADAGTWEVRVDGAVVLSGSGDTRNGANAYANVFHLGLPANGGNNYGNNTDFDDVYLADDTGSAPNNDFLGDIRVECLQPNGNGAASDLVGSDGNSTDNYLLVDEATPDGDTTYVESDVLADRDTYEFEDLVTTDGTVYGVQINPYARKTDAGTRTFKTIMRESGGTEEDGATENLLTSYQYFPSMREEKPSGGAWTLADVNGLQAGYEVVA